MSGVLRRVAVSSEGPGGLDAPVGAHFGRCPSFTMVEVDGDRIVGHQVVPNPFAAAHEPGTVPAFLARLGAHAILSGGMGRRAMDFFAEQGIEASPGHSGSVRSAVEAWLAGRSVPGAPCSGGHRHAHEEGPCHHDGLAARDGREGTP